jgi:hypothetical protein
MAANAAAQATGLPRRFRRCHRIPATAFELPRTRSGYLGDDVAGLWDSKRPVDWSVEVGAGPGHKGFPAMDPWKPASPKAKMPPSEATSQ